MDVERKKERLWPSMGKRGYGPVWERETMAQYGRVARGGYGLPKVSPGPAMFYPSTPCRRATPERPLWQGGWPAAVFYTFEYPTPYAYERDLKVTVPVPSQNEAFSWASVPAASTRTRVPARRR
jgi:hypothetical protein